jgi:Mg-chelatase subunit ChlD
MAEHNESDVNDLLARIANLEALLSQQSVSELARADIWFLLDRSGSMESIAQFVVQGFDAFIAEQRKEEGEATMTLVQFDDRDVHDVLVDAEPLDRVRSIAGRFAPRGMTPLYDAIGLLLDRAEAHLKRSDAEPADQLVVIMTDGMENASHEWTPSAIFKRIAQLQKAGWTFVFLGANQDSYAVGSTMGLAAGNTTNYASSREGVMAVHSGLNRAVREWRSKPRSGRLADANDFWAGVKEGEASDVAETSSTT